MLLILNWRTPSAGVGGLPGRYGATQSSAVRSRTRRPEPAPGSEPGPEPGPAPVDAPVELPFEVLAADGRPVGASVMARLYAAHETPPAATAQERHRLSPVGALGAVTA